MIKDIDKVIQFEAALKKANPGASVTISSFNEWGRRDGDTVYDMAEGNGWVYFIGWNGVYKARPDGTELSKIADGKGSMIKALENGAVTFYKNIEKISEIDEQAHQFDHYSVDVWCTVMPDGEIIEGKPSKGYISSSD